MLLYLRNHARLRLLTPWYPLFSRVAAMSAFGTKRTCHRAQRSAPLVIQTKAKGRQLRRPLSLVDNAQSTGYAGMTATISSVTGSMIRMLSPTKR